MCPLPVASLITHTSSRRFRPDAYKAIGFVEDENVAIAGAGIGVAFDGSGERNGHGAGVGLAAIGLVVDGNERLGGIDNRVGNAHVRAVVFPLAEIGMDADARADVVDNGGGIGIDGSGGNILVPEIVRRKWNEAAETGALARGHLRTA